MQIAIVQIFCEQSWPFCHKLQILLILERVNLDIQAFLSQAIFYLCNDACLRRTPPVGYPLARLPRPLLFVSLVRLIAQLLAGLF